MRPISIIATLALTGALASCTIIPNSGNTAITRGATPSAEVACIDAINNKYDVLGGLEVYASQRTNTGSEVFIANNSGTKWKCIAPVTLDIKPAQDLR